MKIVYVFILVMMLASPTVSQRVIVDSYGEMIVIAPNGSSRPAWQGDSLLVKQYLDQSLAFNSSSEKISTGEQRTKGEEEDFILRQWDELYANILVEEKEIQNVFRSATNAQFRAADQLQNAELNTKAPGSDNLASLQLQYEKSVDRLRNAKLCQKDIKKIVEKAKKLDISRSTLTKNKLEKTKSAFNKFLAECDVQKKQDTGFGQYISPRSTKNTEVTTSKSIPPVKSPSKTAEAQKKAYDPTMANRLPVQYAPIAYISKPFECLFTLDTTEESTGRRRIELTPALIFTFTDPELRPYFKDKDLITCNSWLSKIGPYIYLIVEFQIASSHAQSNFGSLQEGSLLRLKMFDGEYVSLYNLKSDIGRIDPYSGNTLFAGQYGLGKSEIKKISKTALDKMRVMWGTGYEDYDVYGVDVLTNQINCLLSKK